MKLKTTCFLASCFLTATSFGQDFSGYNTGNYTGVNSVFFNPANIADSRYRWDVNLFSMSTSVANNQASYKLGDIFSGSFNGDSIKNKVFGKNAGLASGAFNFNLIGPSVMFNIGKKSSFALTSRARVMMNVKEFDGKLANKVLGDDGQDISLPYTISSAADMQLKLNGWAEFGASYARVLVDKNSHFLKGGITVKYIAGVANAYMNLKNFSSTINQDAVTYNPYLSNTTGLVGLGFGGINITNFEASDLTKFKSTGLGADIGFVYEFRPGYTTGDETKRDAGKYKLKLGVAVLDIGSVKYQRDVQRSGAYNLNITGNKKFYLDEIDTVSLDNYNQFFSARPQYFTPVAGSSSGEYKVSLPTTLQINADYHIEKGFYVNVAGQFSLVSTTGKPYNSQYYNSFAATPRFENKIFGVYLPVSYNELTKFNAGLSLRVGPLFVGSGSIITALLKDSRQADIHIGLRFGVLKHAKKAEKEVKE